MATQDIMPNAVQGAKPSALKEPALKAAKKTEPKAAKKTEPKAAKKTEPKAAKKTPKAAEPKVTTASGTPSIHRESGAGEDPANILGRSAALGLDVPALLVVVCAEGDLQSSTVRSMLKEALKRPTAPPLGAVLTNWLLQVSQPPSMVKWRSDELASVSPAAMAVLDYVASLSGDRLAAYRGRAASAAEWEEAMRDLDKAAARYGSLAGFAHELRAGRLHPNWVQNIGGFTSASYKYCAEQISAAIAAHQKHAGKSRPPRWPASWGGPPSGIEHDMLCAVAVRLSDSPVARRRIRNLRAELVDKAAGNAAQAALLAELGVEAMLTAEPKSGPVRRSAKRRQQ